MTFLRAPAQENLQTHFVPLLFLASVYEMNPLPRLFLSKVGIHGDKYKACRYQKQVEFSINPSHFARVNVAYGCSWKFFLGEGSTFYW